MWRGRGRGDGSGGAAAENGRCRPGEGEGKYGDGVAQSGRATDLGQVCAGFAGEGQRADVGRKLQAASRKFGGLSKQRQQEGRLQSSSPSPSPAAIVDAPRQRSSLILVSYVHLTSPLSLVPPSFLSPASLHTAARLASHGRVSALARCDAAPEQRPESFPGRSSASRQSESAHPRKFGGHLLARRPRAWLKFLLSALHAHDAFIPAREPPQHAQGSSLEPVRTRLLAGMTLAAALCIPETHAVPDKPPPSVSPLYPPRRSLLRQWSLRRLPVCTGRTCSQSSGRRFSTPRVVLIHLIRRAPLSPSPATSSWSRPSPTTTLHSCGDQAQIILYVIVRISTSVYRR